MNNSNRRYEIDKGHNMPESDKKRRRQQEMATTLRYKSLESEKNTNIDESLQQIAQSASDQSQRTIHNIIDDFTEQAFKRFGFTTQELIEKCKQHKIVDIIVDQFIGQFTQNFDQNIDNNNEQEAQTAGIEIKRVIEDFSGDCVYSLLDAFTAICIEHNIGPQALFNAEMRAFLIEKLEKVTEERINSKLEEIFKRNSEVFIADCIVKRGINLGEEAKKSVNTKSIESLINFLAAQKALPLDEKEGFRFDDLYIILYKEFRAIKKVEFISDKTKEKLKTAIGFEPDDDPVNEGKTFDKWFNKYITPLILKAHNKELEEPNGNLREADIIDIRPSALAISLRHKSANRPIEKILENTEKRGENGEIEEIRERLQYPRKNMPGVDENGISFLSDEEVMQQIREQLQEAGNFIKYITHKACSCRKPEDNIHSACRFLEEILNCTSLKDLMTWLVKPETFIEQHPQHQKLEKKIIAHQCRRMLELFLLYRKHIFSPEFRAAQQKRELLENLLTNSLQIKEIENIEVPYRIREEIDPKTGQSPYEEPKDEVVKGEELENTAEGSYRQQVNGKMYEYFPKETKTFVKVSVSIPQASQPPLKTEILIYKGGNELIHCKGEYSYLSSILRGKKAYDLLRWTLVSDDPEALAALRNYIYRKYSAAGLDRVKDSKENRNSGKPGKHSAALYQSSRELSAECHESVVQKVPNTEDPNSEKVEHEQITYETQLMSEDQMLIANSDYTEISHSRAYTPKREFINMIHYLFPPIIYGYKYANYLLQGYDGKYQEAA